MTGILLSEEEEFQRIVSENICTQSEMDFFPIFRFIFVLGFREVLSLAFSVRSLGLSETLLKKIFHIKNLFSYKKDKTQTQSKIVYLSLQYRFHSGHKIHVGRTGRSK